MLQKMCFSVGSTACGSFKALESEPLMAGGKWVAGGKSYSLTMLTPEHFAL